MEVVTHIEPTTAIAMPHSTKQHPATTNLRYCSCWVLVVVAGLGGNWAVEPHKDYGDSIEGSPLSTLG